jgi:ABC-type amino acid transport substrate-binding protein
MGMMLQRKREFLVGAWMLAVIILLSIPVSAVAGADLDEIKKTGVIRHLGVVYANFVTGSGDGLDVELMKLFAQHLGVGYEFVETTWTDAIGDLTGKKVVPKGEHIEITGDTPVKGDVVATGFTILPWRQKVVDYSTPSFPTQIWLVTRSDSELNPIKPSHSVEKDIKAVKALLSGYSVLGIKDTCLDPCLYGVHQTGATTVQFTMTLNALAPAVINSDADTTLLEVPDALTALQKWPGKIKVIGPLSPMQHMAYAFDKKSSRLKEAFNRFFEQRKKDGTYTRLVKKYYPLVFDYYPEFFE